jgi:hypothetical protein
MAYIRAGPSRHATCMQHGSTKTNCNNGRTQLPKLIVVHLSFPSLLKSLRFVCSSPHLVAVLVDCDPADAGRLGAARPVARRSGSSSMSTRVRSSRRCRASTTLTSGQIAGERFSRFGTPGVEQELGVREGVYAFSFWICLSASSSLRASVEASPSTCGPLAIILSPTACRRKTSWARVSASEARLRWMALRVVSLASRI